MPCFRPGLFLTIPFLRIMPQYAHYWIRGGEEKSEEDGNHRMVQVGRCISDSSVQKSCVVSNVTGVWGVDSYPQLGGRQWDHLFSLALCTPMLFKQNGAVPEVPGKTNWQFRHFLLLWRDEVPAAQLNEAEPWLEPQPLTALLSPPATELCLSEEGKPEIWICPRARPEDLCDCGNVQSRKILFPRSCWSLGCRY